MWQAQVVNPFAVNSYEWEQNVTEIHNYWSTGIQMPDVAICGMLGNIQHESGTNPWRWQGDNVPTIAQYEVWRDSGVSNHAYGLFQYDPASKYIEDADAKLDPYYAPNFYDSVGQPDDGQAQLEFTYNNIMYDWSAGIASGYIQPFLDIGIDLAPIQNITWYAFYNGQNGYGEDATLDEMVLAFLLHYERPGYQDAADSYNLRLEYAQKAWDFLVNTPYPERRKRRRWKFYLFM